jgi:two-component sensor histidine kinase
MDARVADIGRVLARQKSLAQFGQQALQTLDLDRLLHDACLEVSRGLDVPMAKIAVRQESGDDLLLVALTGFPERLAVAGRTTVPGGKGSALGYAIETRAPVLSEVDGETRFDVSELVRASGVRCSLNVVIWADGEPFGSLEADSRVPCAFTDTDIDFLQLYANLVGAAVERWRLTRRAETLAREREVLLGELMHRVKNMLTNVAAIAQRTRRHSRTLDEFGSAFDGRLSAIGRAQDLMLSGPEQAVGLRDLLWLELDAKGMREGEQFALTGPDLLLSLRATQVLALLVHELATNAVKYGALSPNAGSGARVAMTWTVEPAAAGERLALRWREHGVALKAVPPRRGFGSEMIENMVPYMLGGSTRMIRHPDGIECLVEFPLVEQRSIGVGGGDAGGASLKS